MFEQLSGGTTYLLEGNVIVDETTRLQAVWHSHTKVTIIWFWLQCKSWNGRWKASFGNGLTAKTGIHKSANTTLQLIAWNIKFKCWRLQQRFESLCRCQVQHPMCSKSQLEWKHPLRMAWLPKCAHTCVCKHDSATDRMAHVRFIPHSVSRVEGRPCTCELS